ncbi:Ribosomal RNA large subunit methyltransferase F [Alishewanella longhuensis]
MHYAADLVAELHDSDSGCLRVSMFRMLDIGCGANCIYPILASRSFGWQVVGSEVDRQALAVAQTIVNADPGLKRPDHTAPTTRSRAYFKWHYLSG